MKSEVIRLLGLGLVLIPLIGNSQTPHAEHVKQCYHEFMDHEKAKGTPYGRFMNICIARLTAADKQASDAEAKTASAKESADSTSQQ